MRRPTPCRLARPASVAGAERLAALARFVDAEESPNRAGLVRTLQSPALDLMSRRNRYEQHYREGRGVCGDPFAEVVAFFDTYDRAKADVLDLGCGQGRDTLLAARLGHRVVGVDLSATGIAQMMEDARAEGLDVEGIVADVAEWTPTGTFDVVILDRVLHLLRDDAERERVLERSCAHTRTGGSVLVADTPKQSAWLREFFGSRAKEWEAVLRRKGFVFAHRIAPPASR